MLRVGGWKCMRLCYMRLKTGEASINKVLDNNTVRTIPNKIILTVLDIRLKVFGGVGLGALMNALVGFAGGDGAVLPLKVLRFWF